MRLVKNFEILKLGFIAVAGSLTFLSNYLAQTLVPVGPFLIALGTFTFAISFTLFDYIRRSYGLAATLTAIFASVVASLVYSLSFGGGMGQIAIASLIALACSGTVDTTLQTYWLNAPLWKLVLFTNVFSLAVDTLVFCPIAFWQVLPAGDMVMLMTGEYLAKMVMSIVAIPMIYGVRRYGPAQTSTARVSN